LLTIEDSTRIAASPEAIWRFLVDPTTFRTWWPGCLEATTADRKLLHEGSELRLLLAPSWIRLRVRARVEVAAPGKALIWVGHSAGLEGRHGFFLEERTGGMRVREQETLRGPTLPVLRLLRLDRATKRMFQENLKGLKRFAEQMV